VTIKSVLPISVGIVILLGAMLLVMRNRQKKGNLASQSGTFSVFQGDIDGHPMLAMIDIGLRDSPEKLTLPFFLSVSTPIINPTSNGLPTGSDADNLNGWEGTVETTLQSAGGFVFVGRVTWNGRRELLYYLKNQQPAIEALKALSDAHSTRPFAFTCERDEKWTKTDFWLNRK
jgi:Family of unknown function (DUF695)